MLEYALQKLWFKVLSWGQNVIVMAPKKKPAASESLRTFFPKASGLNYSACVRHFPSICIKPLVVT